MRRNFREEVVAEHHAWLCGRPILSGKSLPGLLGFPDTMPGYVRDARSEGRSGVPAAAKQPSQEEHLFLLWKAPQQKGENEAWEEQAV